ncbi:hypothetical protein [Prevotella histicola]|uniref:Uncharacterized protein n=1 Tax=Prevotella histicola JCM 15637 = DNF00424 TaxID=1236504 RepID=A0AAW3FDM8_9BACT|nr:hypothetical protein [Prevotella histicola]KGF24892.1 hypothetical protein HMPREF2132_11430 [Prevotella histicola JCM 15637 = DNF00424]
MTQKDLAEEYANERLQGRLSGNEISFSDNKVFTEDDIRAAFNAGRESVVENIPKLLFKETREGLIADNGIFEIIYHIYKSASVDEPRYAFATTYETPIQWYDTLEEAIDAANEDYKERIKQALGL